MVNKTTSRCDSFRCLMVIALTMLFVPLRSLAVATSNLLSYEGYLTAADDTPLSGTFPVKIKFYDSSTADCALFSIEGLTITPSATDGYFNLSFGSATDEAFARIFTPTIVGTSCITGSTRSPATVSTPAAAIKIQISKDGGTTFETMSGVVAISSVPKAIQATYLGTKKETDLIAKPTSSSLGSFLKWNSTSNSWDNFIFMSCVGASKSLHYVPATDTWTCDAIDDSTKLPVTGGTLTGNLNVGTIVLNKTTSAIENTGDIKMSATNTLLLSNNSSDPTMVATDKGKMWYNSISNAIKYYNGTSVKTLASTDSVISSLNGLTAGTQTFAIGTSGTAPAWTSATSTHTLNIPMASASSVTAGLLSKTDYDSFNAKVSSQWTTASGGTSISYNSGNVGIGTTTPSYSLDVNGTINATDVKIAGTSIIASQWTTASGGSYISYGSGNVGIGTSSAPTTKLEVNGGIKATSLDIGATGGIHITSGVPTSTTAALYNNNGTLFWNGSAVMGSGSSNLSGTTGYVPTYDSTTSLSGTSPLFVSKNNVGIGTTTPGTSTVLTIVDTLSTTSNWFVRGSSNALNAIGFWRDSVHDTIFDAMNSSGTNSVRFHSGTNQVSYLTAGNFGVGTVTPAGVLHVARPAPQGTITSSGTNVTGQLTSFLTTFRIGDTIVANGSAQTILNINSDTSITTTNAFSPAITTATTYSRAAAIIENGNVGIGTTTPDATLTIKGAIHIPDVANTVTTLIDFATSNYQYSTGTCNGAVDLKNLKSGASYYLALKNTSDTGNCAFRTVGPDGTPASSTIILKPLTGSNLSPTRHNGKEAFIKIHVLSNTAYFTFEEL